MINTDKRLASRHLVLLCAFIYFISYITRINYGAIISEMVVSTGLSKSALSMALTGSFITYGAGQLISGWFGDRVQPKHLIALGLGASSLMNLLIPFCVNPVQTTAIWCINGFAQSFMWPPLVKLMSSLLSIEDYAHGCVRVSWGCSLGTMLVYLASPLLIHLAGWKSVFFSCAAMGVAGLSLWLVLCPSIELGAAEKQTAGRQKSSLAGISALLLPVMAAIVLHGILRDGVTTWMPSYISETYHLSSEISILTGVIMPIFSIACHHAGGYLYSRKLKNPFLCAGVIFSAGMLSALLLWLLSDGNAAVSVLLAAILTGTMHGVNLILVCILPPVLARGGKVSTISGLLNACTYVGSAISSYAIPLVAEGFSWSATLLMWLLLALGGTALCLTCIPMWKKFNT